MAGVHSAQNTTVVWLITCCVAVNIATLWHIAELCATSSVPLLRYLTESSAFTCSDPWWEKWQGPISGFLYWQFTSLFIEKETTMLHEEAKWSKPDQHSWTLYAYKLWRSVLHKNMLSPDVLSFCHRGFFFIIPLKFFSPPSPLFLNNTWMWTAFKWCC